MTGVANVAKLKKYSDKIGEKLLFIVSHAFCVLTIAFFWAVVTLAVSWFMLGFHPLRLDQIIFFISVLSENIISLLFPVWFPNRSRFMEIACEVISFSLCEIAVFVPTAMNGFQLWDYLKESGRSIRLMETNYGDKSAITLSILANIGYLFILLPLLNIVIHSALIYNLICRDKYTSAVYSVGVKVTYCILGFILLYGSMVTVPDILQPISDVLLILSVQITIFSLVLMQVKLYVSIVKRVEVKFFEWLYLYTHFCVILFAVLALLPILISIVIILTKYGTTPLVNEIKDTVGAIAHMIELKNHQESVEFVQLSIFWSFSCSLITMIFVSLTQDIYLVDRIRNLLSP